MEEEKAAVGTSVDDVALIHSFRSVWVCVNEELEVVEIEWRRIKRYGNKQISSPPLFQTIIKPVISPNCPRHQITFTARLGILARVTSFLRNFHFLIIFIFLQFIHGHSRFVYYVPFMNVSSRISCKQLVNESPQIVLPLLDLE